AARGNVIAYPVDACGSVTTVRHVARRNLVLWTLVKCARAAFGLEARFLVAARLRGRDGAALAGDAVSSLGAAVGPSRPGGTLARLSLGAGTGAPASPGCGAPPV